MPRPRNRPRPGGSVPPRPSPVEQADIYPGLRPFRWHGVEINDPRPHQTQAVGTCPFCYREGKLHVNHQTGLWDCKVCGTDGNPTTFLRVLWEAGNTLADDDPLAADRGLQTSTMTAWGVVRSHLTGDVLVPGYSNRGAMTQLYTYRPVAGRLALVPTPGFEQGQGHALLGPFVEEPWPRACESVHLCEGPWDGMAWWQALGGHKWNMGHDGLVPTGNQAVSLRQDVLVVAVPVATVCKPAWLELAAGRDLVLLYDNDWPRRVCPACRKSVALEDAEADALCPGCGGALAARVAWGAGLVGMRRAAQEASLLPQPPRAVRWLAWGPQGHSPHFPSGTDLRDLLTAAGGGTSQAVILQAVLGWIAPIPEDWVVGRGPAAVKAGRVTLEPLPCDTWKKLRNAWRRAMKWIDGLDLTLSVMLACNLSIDTPGEKVWVLAMGPASTGKTTLCEALAVAREYVHCKSELRSIFSGYKVDREGSEDLSLVPQIDRKCLVVKDIDPLLRSPNRTQVLGQLRDLFDGVTRSHFNNGMGKDYDDVQTGVILCGTGAAQELDSAELGARFLHVLIMEGIDPELEHEINMRSVYSQLNQMGVMVLPDDTPAGTATGEIDGTGTAAWHGHDGGTDPPTLYFFQEDVLAEAKRLTGGFIKHLRENARPLLGGLSLRQRHLDEVIGYGEFVAYMRARPSRTQDEVAEREMSTRLVKQFTKLLTCLCVVLGKRTADADVMDRVRQVALATARGRSLDLTHVLYKAGQKGMDTKTLGFAVHDSNDKLAPLLTFLRRIDAFQYYQPTHTLHHQRTGPVEMPVGEPRWRLTPRLAMLYGRVVAGETVLPDGSTGTEGYDHGHEQNGE